MAKVFAHLVGKLILTARNVRTSVIGELCVRNFCFLFYQSSLSPFLILTHSKRSFEMLG